MSTFQLDAGTQYTIKANSVFDESGNTVNLAIIYQKQLYTLMTKRIAMLNATLANRENIQAGVAIYNLARRNITRNYTAGTTAPDTISKRQVNIPLDLRKEITYGYETLDIQQLTGASYKDGGITVSGAFLQGLIDGKAKSKEAYYYTKLLAGIVKEAVKSPIALTLATTPTTDNYRALWKSISDPINVKVEEVNEEYIGLDREDGILLVSPAQYNNVILATTNLGSDISSKQLQDGEVVKIGGVKVMLAPFLGKSFKAGTLDKDEAFDFSGVDMVWVHKEAFAFPVVDGIAGTFVDSVGNIINYDKFGVPSQGAVALRPTALIGFKLTQSTK